MYTSFIHFVCILKLILGVIDFIHMSAVYFVKLAFSAFNLHRKHDTAAQCSLTMKFYKRTNKANSNIVWLKLDKTFHETRLQCNFVF